MNERVRLLFLCLLVRAAGKQTRRQPVRFECTVEHASFNGEVPTRTQTFRLIWEDFSSAVPPRTGTLGPASGLCLCNLLEFRTELRTAADVVYFVALLALPELVGQCGWSFLSCEVSSSQAAWVSVFT